ncbi:MAG TPA: hypothetical protein VG034_04075 [Acidimicrobiia bacterium]|nr:hypothetical protein [Acidimicrobiia bacterium]
MRPPSRRVDAVIVGLALTALGSAGCRSVTAPEAQPGVPAGRLGAPARMFAVQPSTAAGSALSPSGLEIRWEDVGGARVTVGIAELWSPERQSQFVSGTMSLRAVADDYARRFGAPDAHFVSEGIAGGIDLLHYDSGSLRSTLAGAGDPAVRDGRFFVAVNLDPGTHGRLVPVASDRADPASGHGRLFTVAVMAGRPWAGRS